MNQMKSKAICLETTVRKVDPNFLFPIGLCIFLILQTGCSALRETPPTPALEMALPTVQVTADQIAQAMDQDAFFSTYAFNALIIRGVVSSIDGQSGALIIALKTSGASRVLCDLGNQNTAVHVGDSITVEAAFPNQDVIRQGADVLIRNCSLP